MTSDASVWPAPAELTIPAAAALRDQLLDALAQGVEVLDLSAVREMDCAGAQLLIAARREAQGRGLPLTLHQPSEAVDEVLDRLGLRDLLFGDEPA